MSENTKIAFIVEGTRTEPMLIQNIQKIFFSKATIEFIILPNSTSIYALSKQMENDNSYTDVIEIIKEKSGHQDNRRIDKFNSLDFRNLNRDDYSEIYLFFDYDGHIDLPKDKDHNKIMKDMLRIFDNETENGKLCISYPMIESIKHFSCYELCNEKDLCFYPIEDGALYKKYVSENCLLTDLRYIDKEQWYFIIQKFITIIMCLFNNCLLSKSEYNELVTPMTIFEQEEQLYIVPNNHVMVLSGFTEFLLDYFRIDILEENLNHQLFNDLYIPSDCFKLNDLYC